MDAELARGADLVKLATLPINGARGSEAERAVVYRLATKADGPAIGALFAAADYGDLGVEWQRANVANGWFVADRGGEIVGAVQICAGQPYGFLGDCVVRPDARARDDHGQGRSGKLGQIALTLSVVAVKMLFEAGAQAVFTIARRPGMARIVRRYGGAALGPVELFVWDRRSTWERAR